MTVLGLIGAAYSSDPPEAGILLILLVFVGALAFIPRLLSPGARDTAKEVSGCSACSSSSLLLLWRS